MTRQELKEKTRKKKGHQVMARALLKDYFAGLIKEEKNRKKKNKFPDSTNNATRFIR